LQHTVSGTRARSGDFGLPCVASSSSPAPLRRGDPLEDSRPPPRAANIVVWSCLLSASTIAYALGWVVVGTASRFVSRRARAPRRRHRLLHRLRGDKLGRRLHRPGPSFLPACPASRDGPAALPRRPPRRRLVGMTGMGGGRLMTRSFICSSGFERQGSRRHRHYSTAAHLQSFGAVRPPEPRHVHGAPALWMMLGAAPLS